MNPALLYIIMACAGILMAMLPFGVFMGAGTLMGLTSSNIGLQVAYILILLAVAYGISFGSFALVQKSNCGEVKNVKQIALNSLLPVLANLLLVLLAVFVPWFKNVITGLMPPTLDAAIRDSTAFSYYAFWGTVLGMAVGGTMSASCGKDAFLLDSLNKYSAEVKEFVNPASESSELTLPPPENSA